VKHGLPRSGAQLGGRTGSRERAGPIAPRTTISPELDQSAGTTNNGTLVAKKTLWLVDPNVILSLDVAV